ncbi:MAG: hypothetical protein KBD78_02290 [Oligoflexales bacterium]|nr:hypothetical protein [Oligoflexales bacterium]
MSQVRKFFSILIMTIASQTSFADSVCPTGFSVTFDELSFESTALIYDEPLFISETSAVEVEAGELNIEKDSLGYSYLSTVAVWTESFKLDQEYKSKCVYVPSFAGKNSISAEISWRTSENPILKVTQKIGVNKTEELVFIVNLVKAANAGWIILLTEEPVKIFSNEIIEVNGKQLQQWIFLGVANKGSFYAESNNFCWDDKARMIASEQAYSWYYDFGIYDVKRSKTSEIYDEDQNNFMVESTVEILLETNDVVEMTVETLIDIGSCEVATK